LPWAISCAASVRPSAHASTTGNSAALGPRGGVEQRLGARAQRAQVREADRIVLGIARRLDQRRGGVGGMGERRGEDGEGARDERSPVH
jgi:hypothetical protein